MRGRRVGPAPGWGRPPEGTGRRTRPGSGAADGQGVAYRSVGGVGRFGVPGCAAVRAQFQVSPEVGESGFAQGTGGGRAGGPGAGTRPDADAGHPVGAGEPEPGPDQSASGAGTVGHGRDGPAAYRTAAGSGRSPARAGTVAGSPLRPGRFR